MSIDTVDVKSRAKLAYELMEHPWPEADIWSTHTKHSIADFVREFADDAEGLVFNAGCGGNDYGLADRLPCFNLDISLRQCRTLSRAVVGDVEHIPFPADIFDITMCVGAVINYVEPENAIPELIRVTKPGGLILVDFESSCSAEIMFSRHWRKPVSVIERMYVDHLDKTYLFSPDHIRGIFERNHSEVVKARSYHTATAMWERIFTKAHIPKAAYTIDRFASSLPGIGWLGSSVIFACQKELTV